MELFLWAGCAVDPIPEGLGAACFSLACGGGFHRRTLGLYQGLVFVFVVILAFKVEVGIFKQNIPRI